MNNLFLELIQLALGTKNRMSCDPSVEEWHKLYDIADKQSVLGVCFAGVEKLLKEQNPDIDLLMEWLGQTEYIKTRNEEVNRECAEFYKKVHDDGYTACVLKGQAVGSLYRVCYNKINTTNTSCGQNTVNTAAVVETKTRKTSSIDCDSSSSSANSMSECSNADLARQPQNHQTVCNANSQSTEDEKPAPSAKNLYFDNNLKPTETSEAMKPSETSDINLSLYRSSGDIDMWMVAEPKEVIEWARKTGKMYYYDYHHADLSIYDDTEIELHYRPSLSRNLVRNGRLQRWFREEGKKHIVFNEELGFAVPDYLFSVILTLNHNFWHLLYEGVGMRQIIDLYFVLRSAPCFRFQSSKSEALKLLKHFNLLDFTAASMWIMKEVFGLEEEYLLCEPDEKRGRFLLDEIMKAGNFGHSDERLNKSRYSKSRIGLMLSWMKHTFRLITQYPADVLWTPIGVMRISLWRRWH